MAPTLLGGAVCDRSDCPAPAAHQLLISGQDFYFCDHHAAELPALMSIAVACAKADAVAPQGPERPPPPRKAPVSAIPPGG
jgi:hypothetical protein